MTSTRHLIPDTTYADLQEVAYQLRYRERGKHSKWKLVDKLMAYAKEHPDLFKL